jgi:cell wall-associated NlpC family hydrolase
MASGRPDLRWAAKARVSAAFLLAGAVAGTALYIGNLAHVRAGDEAASAATAERQAAAERQTAAGNAALNWAERHATGCWYYYGGSSCSPGYDPSGLVRGAFGYGAGIWLPHSTYTMLGNSHLHSIPLSQARRGDLMFYGSGHVEINTIWYHQTFGAHDRGQRVGWITWGPWWYPTAAYRVW